MYRNAYLLLVLTALFWAGNSIAGKYAVGHISPMLLNTMRWLIAASILLAIGLPQLRRDWPVVKRNIPLLFCLGAVGFTVFNTSLYTALYYTSVINVSIEQAAMPMMVFAANFILYRIGVGWGQIVGFTLSLVGVALTATHGNLWNLAQLQINFGDALMLVAIVAYAGYTVALRYKPAIHWKSMMTGLCFAAIVSSLPLTAWEFASGNTVLPDMQGWAVVAYTAILPSLLSQIFYMRGVELIGGNRAGLFINLVPIFGTILSILLLGEAFHFYHAIALAMVLGGIWLAENSGRKRAARDMRKKET